VGSALIEYWRGRLGKAERSILEALAEAYPDALTKGEVAARAGYEANGGGFNNALRRLRTLELVQGRGELRASDNLFNSPAG
jgi:predicted transcriptional regulator